MKKRNPLENLVAKAFRKHYRAMKDDTKAHNAVLEELAGRYNPNASEESHKYRQDVVRAIGNVRSRELRRAGDPHEIRVREAMRRLRAEGAADATKKAWRNYVAETRHEARKAKQSFDHFTDMYPCEHYLYICFDRTGELRRWTVDHAQYYQGCDGLLAAVSIPATYKDIEREVRDALARVGDDDE